MINILNIIIIIKHIQSLLNICDVFLICQFDICLRNHKIETKCIQSGYEPGNGEPRVLPIYQSTTFKYNSSDQMGRLFALEESGYFYTRLQNPTNDAVAAKICDLEGGVAAMLTSSGQAANFYAIMNICEEGDHIVCASAVYGGTYNSSVVHSGSTNVASMPIFLIVWAYKL